MGCNINGYGLSRDWFDFCFENPDLISPTHTAMYFFIIEHCNRLGWKEKFGLPMEMTKEAIGIKNYRTFSKTFNDLVDWGFINIIQKSKNQYSSNIIAIVKNTKANTKALSKAMQNHSQKQVHSIVGIDKPITIKPKTIKPITWRENFDIYKNELYKCFEEIKKDNEFIKQQEKFNPNINILLSIEKSIANYWGLETGWNNKKKSKTKVIDWISTFKNSISQPMNKVYKNSTAILNKGSEGKLAI
jgi:hypothetical protein